MLRVLEMQSEQHFNYKDEPIIFRMYSEIHNKKENTTKHSYV